MELDLIDESLKFAEELQGKIEANMQQSEKNFHNKMQKLLNNPKNKIMLIELLDRAFRCKDKSSTFEFIETILRKYGIADFFTSSEKFLLFCFLSFGGVAPKLSVPFFVKHLRDDTKGMVLDENPTFLESHIGKRASENITLNINLIGEEVLGEDESNHRIEKYKKALQSKFVTYISIKITTIFSQINIIDFEYSKDEIVKRLNLLYKIAQEEQERQGISKFINLDMEEFRDLELTVSSFMESISNFDIEAGIVLQAYIPDSFDYLQKLFAFSKERVLNGKKPIKIRFVKGANMESEETIASQRGWELPTFSKKVDTDSNYNKMLDFILSGDNYKYINIGIASHNIFEISYAYTKIKHKNALSSFTFEMLEGMSMQCAKEISQLHKLILYAPVCDESHFNNAIAYLVRRLDENTSVDNFMRYFFNLKVGDNAWEAQKKLFLESLDGISKIDSKTHRIQNRLLPQKAQSSYDTKRFYNEPDTDFILPQNRQWAKNIRQKYENMPFMEVFPVAKEELKTSTESITIKERINNKDIGKIHLASKEDIQEALKIAKDSSFSETSFSEIYKILAKTAQIMRDRRGDLIGISALEVGKTFVEIDAEVSEAIDFLEFYPHSLESLMAQNENTSFSPKGIGVVVAPWNFPIGISVGTIAAPLAAGNRVIYKPSSLSTLSGYMICECFWEAGIPKDALIFMPTKGSYISEHLLKDSSICFAVLTGGEETAYAMLDSNPTLMLSAETGGKNATIVSKFADRDQAIKNVIHSAFSNSGQKCSATSLLILEDEVYDDLDFRSTLVDAAKSLNVGNPFEFKNKLGALANSNDKKAIKAVNELEGEQEWALKPSFVNDNPYLMTPCIKYGVRVGEFMHKEELFSPILSVMRARDLEDAIAIANSTGYGLTAALESLDEREWEIFASKIEAGNIYVNKPSTGAIVLRQPFGGVKKSAIGFGRKVGIYNYITQFLNVSQHKTEKNLIDSNISEILEKLMQTNPNKDDLRDSILMAKSYAYHKLNEFSVKRDYVNIRGEENWFYYESVKNVGYYVCSEDSLKDMLGVLIATHTLGIPLFVCYKDNKHIEFLKEISSLIGASVGFVEQSKEEFAQNVSKYERIRYFAKPCIDDVIYKSCAKLAKIIASSKPLINGRFELLYYVIEKSLSISYHRYGNLGIRGEKNGSN